VTLTGRLSIAAWVLVALAFQPAALWAQRYSFKLYGHEQGLGNLVTQCLLQDRAGYLWVGTQNGLFRYDGWRFRRFDRDDGLPTTRVDALHESADGVLWVGTRAGLVRRNGDRFEPIHVSGDYEILGQQSIASDSRGWIYVATTAGLLTGRPSSSGLQWRFQWLGTPTGPIYSVHLVPGGEALWLGCAGGLFRLASNRLTLFDAAAGVPEDRWHAIASGRNGDLWVRSATRLLVLRQGAAQFVPADHGLPGNTGRPSLFVDSQGRLFVPTDLGLAFRAPNGWDLIDSRRGLAADAVSSALEDREGSLWIGLSGSGLARWLGRGAWETWTHSEGLSNDSVWAVLRDRSGTLWAGTDFGLNFRRAEDPVWRPWNKQHPLGSTKIRSLQLDRDGSLWVGAGLEGIFHFDPLTRFARHYGREAGLSDTRVFALLVDGDGRVWAATSAGLFLSAGGGPALRFERQSPPNTDETERFYALLQDRQGTLWVAGGRGLLRFAAEHWTRFTRRDGLVYDSIGHLASAPDGSLWIGYRDGYGASRVRFAGDRLLLDHYNAANGPRSGQSVALAVDSRGRLWYGSDSGVDVFDGRSWRHYGLVDGLAWENSNSNAIFAESGGDVWVGTSTGLAHFLAPDDEPRALPPAVRISTVAFGPTLADPARSTRVPYADRFLRVSFSALTFLNEGEVRFRYRLAGGQKGWIDTSQHEVQYPALPPGAYTFEVAAHSARGVWSAEPARMSFEILPPWWQTDWFRGLVVLLSVLAVWMLWRLRSRRLEARRRELEAAVEARTAELAAEKARTETEKLTIEKQNQEIQLLLEKAQEASRLKSEFLANVSHEIRTPMNGVLGMQALALSTPLSEEQREYLETAQVSAVSLLGLLNDVLDFSKIEAGKLDLDLMDFSLRELLDAAAKTMSGRAAEKGLRLNVEIAPGLPDALRGDATRLRQVLLNLLGNAVKFTNAGHIDLRVAQEPNAQDLVLRFSVADTGIGIPRDKQQIIFEEFRQADSSTTRKYGGAGLGLGICTRLVALMGGRIWVESEPGHGSTFHFTARLSPAAPAPPCPAETVSTSSFDLASPAGRSLHILLAEDNPVNQKCAVRLLEKMGHRVQVVSNGSEAVDTSAAASFDLLLTDVQMPEMDGLAATRLIRERERGSDAHLPILGMTAYAMRGDRERCLDAGMDGYIAKPVQPQELREAIQAAVSLVQAPQPVQ
jgi:signal transduction histidine kinase/ActR/RegA family two-component response regulator/streptogramin lyase